MSLVQLKNVTKTYGATPVINEVDLEINQGERIGIIGLNGCGKTTLLKLISGELDSETGQVMRSKDLRLAVVPQVIEEGLNRTILEFCYDQHPELSEARKEIERYEATLDQQRTRIKQEQREALERYHQALERFQLAGGYSLEAKIAKQLRKIGMIHLTPEKKLEQLSAGELKVTQIASALITNPEVLIIDEPTNHADTYTSEAIDTLITSYPGTVVYVTHDRQLINKVCGRIVEVQEGKTREFVGTYDQYIEFKQDSFNADMKRYQAQKKQKKRLTASMWKMKGRGQAGYDKAARQAKAMERRIERMDLQRPDQVTDRIRIDLQDEGKVGNLVLGARGVYKGYCETEVLKEVNLEITVGQRIGIIGNSGAGKTTLLNCLLGFEPVDAGVVKRGPSVRVGYLSQNNVDLDTEATIFDELRKAGCPNPNAAYGLLNKWLFRDCDIHRRVDDLSSGEKKKVQIIKIMLIKPNLLVLDEPTDHLDMASREGLELAVSEFGGTLIASSQDRQFLDSVADYLLVITNHQVRKILGGYTDNLEEIAEYLQEDKLRQITQ